MVQPPKNMRKKNQSDPNQASSSRSIRTKKKLGIRRGGGIAAAKVTIKGVVWI